MYLLYVFFYKHIFGKHIFGMFGGINLCELISCEDVIKVFEKKIIMEANEKRFDVVEA